MKILIGQRLSKVKPSFYNKFFGNFSRNDVQMKKTPGLKTFIYSPIRNMNKRKGQDDLKLNQGKHVKITSNSYRDSTIISAIVSEVYSLSGTVNGYTLQIKDASFKFYAGQWVDTFIPNLETVGGFSICSPPSQFEKEGTISLGIKKSNWPPAKWFTKECTPGSQVSLRVGGDFYYPHTGQVNSDLLLVAGGVGVNPILSIFLHFVALLNHQNQQNCDKSLINTAKVCFLFSAKSRDELIYKETIDSVARKHSKQISVRYFTTRESCNEGVLYNRISFEDIAKALATLNKSNSQVYVCGPPSMIESVVNCVEKCDVPKCRIHYEKWW